MDIREADDEDLLNVLKDRGIQTIKTFSDTELNNELTRRRNKAGAGIMPLSPEVAQLLGLLQNLTGNNLSSVEINHNTKGDTWSVKVYHENPEEAYRIADEIEKKCRERCK